MTVISARPRTTVALNGHGRAYVSFRWSRSVQWTDIGAVGGGFGDFIVERLRRKRVWRIRLAASARSDDHDLGGAHDDPCRAVRHVDVVGDECLGVHGERRMVR
jgi:hypothetical protein